MTLALVLFIMRGSIFPRPRIIRKYYMDVQRREEAFDHSGPENHRGTFSSTRGVSRRERTHTILGSAWWALFTYNVTSPFYYPGDLFLQQLSRQASATLFQSATHPKALRRNGCSK